ncbi:rod shape-determining protein MreC [Legionella geestiana]|nr:rod shape-determining protein MreC [Legionella geestiana]
MNRLFAKARHRSMHFVLAMMASLILMFFDYHYRCLETLRSGFGLLVAPLQYAVDYPVRVVGWVQSQISSRKALIDENMQLHYRQTILEAELQTLLAMKDENSRLRELLLTASNARSRSMAAQILAVDTSTARQLVVLNKGKRDGVYEGQPVLDARGVMGQIIDVGLMTSTVLLVSDAKCAVPVRNNRTGERAILVGTNRVEQLSLINLPKTSDTRKGDLLVTSGLGQLYPEGYPVGFVQSVRNVPGDDFVKVNVSPLARLNRSRMVLLVWPTAEQVAMTEQVRERIDAIGEKLG